MVGVSRARYCHNRKDPESTYLPMEVLYQLNDGAPRGDQLDLSSWGVCDDDMPAVAAVRRNVSLYLRSNVETMRTQVVSMSTIRSWVRYIPQCEATLVLGLLKTIFAGGYSKRRR